MTAAQGSDEDEIKLVESEIQVGKERAKSLTGSFYDLLGTGEGCIAHLASSTSVKVASRVARFLDMRVQRL